jgi:hypothetical protein
VKVVRAALVAVILFNLALLASYAPFRNTGLRYEVARQERERRALAVEAQTLRHKAAEARRPDRVAARAAALGVDLHQIEQDALVDSSGLPAAPRGPVENRAPRR